MSSFNNLRTQVVALENKTESLLGQYSKLEATPEPSEAENELRHQIENSLSTTEQALSKLNSILEIDISLPSSKLSQLSRLQDNYNSHTHAFKRITAQIEADRNRHNLLYNLQLDLTAHKNRSQQIDTQDYTLDELIRADNANSLADRLLQLAYATRDELFHQRQVLAGTQSSMLNALQHVPGINVLISRINTRRKRDTVVLATVISVCIILLLFFL